VSSVQQYVTIGSISQPVIGQQANIADIRLREGEVNILGGLNQTQDTATSNGIPGLVNIPILGKILFGNDHTDKVRSDLLIALIPHIVRTPDYTVENMRGIYVGTDQVVKINYAPKSAENGAPAGTPTPGVSTQGTSTQGSALPASPSTQAPAASQPPVLRRAPSPAVVPVPPAPSGSPVLPPAPPVPTASLVPNSGDGATNSSAATSPVKAMEAAAHVGFLPPNIVTPVGSAVVVNVELEGANNITMVGTLRVRYNPSQLRLNEISPGALLARDGVRLNTVKEISNEQGEAVISIARPDGAPGVSGAGAIAGLTFTAIAPGSSPVEVTEFSVSDAHGGVVAASLGKLPVTVQ